MSYKNPVIPTFTNLRGIDREIESIKNAMSFSWLGKAFGLADRVRVGDKLYPACFEGNRVDPISMMPSDLYKSFCFWVKDADAEIDGREYPFRSPVYNYQVSCIFYMDIRRINSSLSYKLLKSRIREDIFDFFNNLSGRLEYVGSVEDDFESIYNGYEVDQEWMMYPKWAIRLNFELSFREECYNLTRAGTLSTTLLDKFLYLWTGKYKSGNLHSDIDDTVITVTGKDWPTGYIPPSTAATFSVPNNSTYSTADTDNFWFNPGILSKTHGDLIASETDRTFVKYSDYAPYNIYAIGILKSGEVLTDADKIELNTYFWLWVQYWGATMAETGYMKDNRTFI